ncbi:MAG: hypothetical protein QXT73_02365 [Candidatus Methanomethylicaceae archaeon]
MSSVQVDISSEFRERFTASQLRLYKKIFAHHAKRLGYKHAEVLDCCRGAVVDPPLGTLTFSMYSLPAYGADIRKYKFTDVLRDDECQQALRRVAKIAKQEIALEGELTELSFFAVRALLDSQVQASALRVEVGRFLVALALNHTIYFTPNLENLPWWAGMILLDEALTRITKIPTRGLEVTREVFFEHLDVIARDLRESKIHPIIGRVESEFWWELTLRQEAGKFAQWERMVETCQRDYVARMKEKIRQDVTRLLAHPGVHSIKLSKKLGISVITEAIIIEKQGLYYDLGSYRIDVKSWALRSVQATSATLLPHPRILRRTIWTPPYRESIHEALAAHELYLGVELVLQTLRDVDDGFVDINFWPKLDKTELLCRYPNLDMTTLWPKKE